MTMKFTIAALLAAFTTACFAQNVNIGSPANGTSVTPGSSLVVEVDRPDTLTGSIEIAIVIGIQSCDTVPCSELDNVLGTNILFNGPFNPQFSSLTPSGPPHQNFTVTIPPTLAQGTAHLSVFHVALLGASNGPITQLLPLVLNVV